MLQVSDSKSLIYRNSEHGGCSGIIFDSNNKF